MQISFDLYFVFGVPAGGEAYATSSSSTAAMNFLYVLALQHFRNVGQTVSLFPLRH